jgi:hypothetical protein
MTELPTLIKSPIPKNIPDPFSPLEEFMLQLATGDGGLRPYHFGEMGGADPIKARQAVSSGMNMLRAAADMEVAESKSIVVDNHTVVVYAPKEAAKEFWTQNIAEGKDAKATYDAWVALRELMDSVRGKDSSED